jgi:hypothetical protein
VRAESSTVSSTIFTLANYPAAHGVCTPVARMREPIGRHILAK